jgi:hypothetical protein
MTVTLNTDEAFSGKLFSYVNPRGCTKKGGGNRATSLTFQYENPNEKCGVERAETEGAYTNTVVVQHHPVIQKKGDREEDGIRKVLKDDLKYSGFYAQYISS